MTLTPRPRSALGGLVLALTLLFLPSAAHAAEPNTTITAGPTVHTYTDGPSTLVSFTAGEPVDYFECRVVGPALVTQIWGRCGTDNGDGTFSHDLQIFGTLLPGQQVIEVRAVSASAEVETTPAQLPFEYRGEYPDMGVTMGPFTEIRVGQTKNLAFNISHDNTRSWPRGNAYTTAFSLNLGDNVRYTGGATCPGGDPLVEHIFFPGLGAALGCQVTVPADGSVQVRVPVQATEAGLMTALGLGLNMPVSASVTPNAPFDAVGSNNSFAFSLNPTLLPAEPEPLDPGPTTADPNPVEPDPDPVAPDPVCTPRAMSLVRADLKGGKVRLSGVVGTKFAGKHLTVQRALDGKHFKAIKRIKANKRTGEYSVSVRKPAGRAFKKARFRMSIGRLRSKALKLPQQLVSHAAKGPNANTVTIQGQIDRPVIGKRTRTVVIRRLMCGRYKIVGVGTVDQAGQYMVVVSRKGSGKAGFYRAEAKVLARAGSKRHVMRYARAVRVQTVRR